MGGPFRVDVYNAAGARLNGTSIEIGFVSLVQRASRIGEISFDVPAEIAADQGFVFGARYRVYHATLGDMGQFRHDSDALDADGRVTTIKALDQLVDLNNVVFGFNKTYNAATVTTVIAALASGVGWAASCANDASEFYAVTRDFQGATVFQAIDAVRADQRGFFALAGTAQIRFGRWTAALLAGAVDGYLVNTATPGAAPSTSSGQALITALRVNGEGANVVNRIIPRGAGTGETQLDLRYSDRTTPYTILNRANGDGTFTYYIEDAASIAAYGVVERTVPFSDIRPITNSKADIKNAANALYDMATVYLQQFKAPVSEYEIECVNPPTALRPGSVVVVDFRGVAERDGRKKSFLRVNQRMFVLEITRKFEGASVVARLTVSSSGERASDAIDVFSNVLKDLEKFKLKLDPAMTYYSRNGGERAVKSGLNYDFQFDIGSEVQELNALVCKFSMRALRVYASNSTASGGSSTVTSASGGSNTPTSALTNVDHNHGVAVVYGSSGSPVYFNSSYGRFESLAGTSQVNSFNTGIGHTHTVTIPSHTHDVSIPSHTHDVSIPSHTHPLSFAVSDDAVTPTNLRIYLDGTEITSVRQMSDGTFVSYPLAGIGWFTVDLLPALQAMSDWRGNHTLSFQCGSNQGAVFAEIQGRVTIQPIRVS